MHCERLLPGGPRANGDELCFVTMTGVKRGRTIAIPLMYVLYQQDVLLVASQAGG